MRRDVGTILSDKPDTSTLCLKFVLVWRHFNPKSSSCRGMDHSWECLTDEKRPCADRPELVGCGVAGSAIQSHNVLIKTLFFVYNTKYK